MQKPAKTPLRKYNLYRAQLSENIKIYFIFSENFETFLEALYWLDQIWTGRGDTFNAVFDSKLTVYEALSRVAKVGRAITFIQGGIVRFVRDEPKTISVALF